MTDTETLANKSVISTGWNLAANIFMTLCSFLRTFILARLLSIETFGIYGKALSFVFITLPLLYLGRTAAMLHRAPETENEEQSAAVMFSLSLVSSLTWTLLMILAANLFFDLSDASAKTAFYALIAAEALSNLTSAPQGLYGRKVDYKRQALIVFIQFFIGTLLSVSLAWLGAEIWALVSMNLVTAIVAIVVFYLWRPVFRPRWLWQTRLVRYYFEFGSKVAFEELVYSIQERIDDLWTAAFLGIAAAGFYTQAHVVARYPLKIISLPLISVAGATLSALKHDKATLTQTFEIVCGLLTRLTFFIGGLVLFISQEFVILYLSEKWLPLLNVLRIMVVYMMIEPIKETLSRLFSAIGYPERALQARLWQLASLITGIGVFSWMLSWNIEGVALAVNLSVLVGLFLMIHLIHAHLEISWRRIFSAPSSALAVTALIAFIVFRRISIPSIWVSVLSKIGFWTIVFSMVEWIIDRQYLAEILRITRKYVIKKGG